MGGMGWTAIEFRQGAPASIDGAAIAAIAAIAASQPPAGDDLTFIRLWLIAAC